MNPSDIIARKTQLGFLPTPRFLGLWREAGASQGLRPGVVMAGDDGKPLPTFLGLWRGSLLRRPPYPHDVLFNEDGTPTQAMVRLWRG